MERVLIDPEMLMLQNKDEIVKNIIFFQNVIKLSGSGNITVCLYKEIIDSILGRSIRPFPININEISDYNLKQKLIALNVSFTRSIMNSYIEIDIDSCKGSQDFITDRKDMEKTSNYFAFFNMLLINCYSSSKISEKILVGEKKEGILAGEYVSIECCCESESESFVKTYSWISPDEFLNDKQKAEEKLKTIMRENPNLYVESPEVKKGSHHNHIQSEDFNCYEQLATKNKRIFNYLRSFGLYRIVFGEFAPDASREVGAIKVTKVDEYEDSDIVSGWLFACLEFRIFVELYFPKGIGKLLFTYSELEMTRKKMDELKSSLAK